jgi:hypothetical protein
MRRIRLAVKATAQRHTTPQRLRLRIEALAQPRASAPWHRFVLAGRRLFAAPVIAWRPLGVALSIATLTLSVVNIAVWQPARDERLMQAAVTSHLQATTARPLVDMSSSDRATVQPWLADRLGFLAPVVVPSASDATLVGARMDTLDGRSVATAAGRLEAGLVVNAAGAAAPALTPGLPIVPRRGHLAITDRYPGFCRHQVLELGYLQSAHSVAGASVAFNVQPRVTGQVLIGSSRELVGWDRSTNHTLLARMLDRAVAFMPRLAALSVLRSWIGFRPATPDKLPLIGRWPASDGMWIAAGHEGLGITTALGTAQLLGDLVLGRPPSLDPVPFDPARAIEPAGATSG